MSKSSSGSARSKRPGTKNPSTRSHSTGQSQRPSATSDSKTKRPTNVRGAAANSTGSKHRPPSRAGKSHARSQQTANGANGTRRTFRSRHPLLTALVPLGLVVAAIATMVIIKASSGPSRAPAIATSRLGGGGGGGISDPGTTPLAPGVLTELSSVAPTTFAAVGSPASVTPPTSVGHKGPILRDATGKPVITYIGAEYCPYCAAERWALAVALSRFGTFSNLSGTHSSSTDIYPNTQTLSFYGSGYSSPYVSFDSVESATNEQVNGTYPTLQTPTAQQSTLLSSYDPSGNIPFLDIGNKYLITGASYSPQLLQGLSGSQIASQLNNPSSAVAQAIDGTANNITAAICAVTGNTPSSVASSPTIAAIEKSLGA